METRTGHKHKIIAAEDIYGRCLCDHTLTELEINNGNALKCAYEGCATGWVMDDFTLYLHYTNLKP